MIEGEFGREAPLCLVMVRTRFTHDGGRGQNAPQPDERQNQKSIASTCRREEVAVSICVEGQRAVHAKRVVWGY